jgi:hypothetical protein
MTVQKKTPVKRQKVTQTTVQKKAPTRTQKDTYMTQLVKPTAISGFEVMSLNGYELRSQDITIEPGSAVVRTLVPCPAGKKAISAGWRETKLPLERLGLWESGPSDDQRSWVFSVVNEGSKKVTVRLYVICAYAPPGSLTVTALTGDLTITAAAGPDHTVQLKVTGDDGLDYTEQSTFASSDITKATVSPGPGGGGLVTGVAATAAPVNEVQTVTITGSPASGAFTLSFRNQTTAPIAHNADATAVRSALAALSTIGTGNVAVTGGPGPDKPFTVTFQGALGLDNVDQMTAAHTFSGGTSPNVSVATTTPGVPPVKINVSCTSAGLTTQLTASAVITVV